MGVLVDFPFAARLGRATWIEPVEVATSAGQDTCRAMLWYLSEGMIAIPSLQGPLADVLCRARHSGSGLPVLVSVKAQRRART